ncbi:MAG: RDD family protein [Opitutae bacterium]|nr:RDD family protein [Opitutae bacterium]
MFTILGSDGKEYGPVSTGQIKEWMHGNRVNLQTQCRRVGETTWRTVGEFPEFGFAGARAFVPPPEVPSAAPVPGAANVAEFAAQVADADGATLELARRGTRLVAQLIDSMTALLFLLPAGIMLVLEGGTLESIPPATSLVLLGCACALLILQGYLLTEYGQTVGKKLMEIRIVRWADEAKPGFTKAFLLRLLVPGLLGSVPLVGWIFTLVDVGFIFRSDRRCVHDLIAGTKVVKG